MRNRPEEPSHTSSPLTTAVSPKTRTGLCIQVLMYTEAAQETCHMACSKQAALSHCRTDAQPSAMQTPLLAGHMRTYFTKQA